jgi:ATP-dependent Clp protease ATP-binding subunit ClpA
VVGLCLGTKIIFNCKSWLVKNSDSYTINISGHNYIGSEHLLLGLLREGEGVAARVLENLGADPTNIRTQASIMPSFFFFL